MLAQECMRGVTQQYREVKIQKGHEARHNKSESSPNIYKKQEKQGGEILETSKTNKKMHDSKL